MDEILKDKNKTLYRRLKNIKREKLRLRKQIIERDELINKLQEMLDIALRDKEWISVS